MNCSVMLALMTLALFSVVNVMGKPSRRVPSHPSPLLHDKDINDAVHEVAQHAQKSDFNIDVRLNANSKQMAGKDHWEVCCLHANILDFYLHSILRHRAAMHSKMPQLMDDLSRISRDLTTDHGCSISHYTDNPHSMAFSEKLSKMGEDEGINKAVGEIDILFTYLRDSCFNKTP